MKMKNEMKEFFHSEILSFFFLLVLKDSKQYLGSWNDDYVKIGHWIYWIGCHVLHMMISDSFIHSLLCVCVHYYKTSLYKLHNHHQHHFVMVGIYLWSLSSPLIINWCQIWLHNTDVKSIQMTESHLSYLRILSSAICLEIIFFKKIEKNKSKSKKQTVLICSFENLRAITNWRKTKENQWRFSLYYSLAHGFFQKEKINRIFLLVMGITTTTTTTII